MRLWDWGEAGLEPQPLVCPSCRKVYDTILVANTNNREAKLNRSRVVLLKLRALRQVSRSAVGCCVPRTSAIPMMRSCQSMQITAVKNMLIDVRGINAGLSKLQAPSSKLQAPSSKLQAPSSKLQAPSSKLQAPSFKLSTSSLQYLSSKFHPDRPRGYLILWLSRQHSPSLTFDFGFRHSTSAFGIRPSGTTLYKVQEGNSGRHISTLPGTMVLRIRNVGYIIGSSHPTKYLVHTRACSLHLHTPNPQPAQI